MAIDATKYNIFVKIRGEEDTEYKGVGCVLSYEGLLHKGTRDLAGSDCREIPANPSEMDNGKRLKAKKYDSGSITYVYNPTATDGQKILNDAFDEEELDIKLTIKMVLNDKGSGASATYFERDVLVTSCEPTEEDEQYVEKAAFQFLNAPRKTDRVA